MSGSRKTAVVIGATGNLGGHVCHVLEEEDFECDRPWMISDHPDVTKPDAFERLPETIDLTVYPANTNAMAPVAELSLKTWNRVLSVNLTGAFLFTKAVIPRMRNAGGGLIVYAGSINSMVSYPGRAAYTASKCGLEGLTGVVAVEEGGNGISAVCLAMGHLEGLMKSTPANPRLLDAVQAATPSGNLVSAADVANLIATLYRVRGSISGHVIPVEPAYTINRWPLTDGD